jgi:catechol 2,3-dioxygenase-like lactoylglutathione lyase family enzyme
LRIKSISHTGLTVSNFESAVRWYHEKFGFLLVSEDRLGKAETAKLFPLYGVKDAVVRLGFLRAPGGSVVEIFQFEPASEGGRAVWNAPGFTHIALNVSALPRVTAKLAAEGVEFATTIQRTGKVEWVFLLDPDGNLIELIDLKAARPLLKIAGGIVGRVFMRGKFAPYYRRPADASSGRGAGSAT